MRLKLLTSVLIIASTLLTACETMTASKTVAVSANETWALLPIQNLSKTPLAGNRAKALVETHLRAHGVRNIDSYNAAPDQTILALLDDNGQLEAAKKWAKDKGYTYGVTGNVQEWQYKNGLDNEPSVGLTLKFINLLNDEVMWVASASRTGWGYNNLSNVASKTIEDILAEVRFKGPQPSRMMVAATPEPVQPLKPLPPPMPTVAAVPPPLPQIVITEPAVAAALPEISPEDSEKTTSAPAGSTLVLPSPYETNLQEDTNR